MSNVAGKWECLTKTPLGDQKSVLTVEPSADGTSFTGSNAGAMGTLEVLDGKINGNELTWKMDMKVPMPMSLEARATVDGDAISGEIKAGAFGSSPLSGTRQA